MQKAITMSLVILVSVHFIEDTFWPSCGLTMTCVQCNKLAIHPYIDIPIPVFVYMDEAMQKVGSD